MTSASNGTKPRPSASRAWLRALEATGSIGRQPGRTLPSVIEELAERFGDRPALLDETSTLSFRALAERARLHARWARSQGIGPDDVVALLMGNRPDYVAAWIGLVRTGAVVALVNTQLAGDALAHALRIVGARHVVVAPELADALAAVVPRLAAPPEIWVAGKAPPDGRSLDQALAGLSAEPLADDEIAPPTISDAALYIYTSGTTGLPKAAIVTHGRVMSWCFWFAGMAATEPDDRLYLCLPMYHSIGGVAAPGAVLVHGGSVFIRDRFSARRFWDDVARRGCTLFQYIGELCRYLVAAPLHERERSHGLRLCLGNGLRPEVWEPFRTRFAIPQILEFYAATEANVSLYNVEGEPGAIGRIPPFLAARFPIALVQSDPDSGEPVRGADGHCRRAGTDEPGEALGRIEPRGTEPGQVFTGYSSHDETERKILRDVFEPRDAWFRTGDLMRLDARGFYRFVDRIGDTFRWKGENVATTEVAAVIAACPGVVDVAVYGVTVPGADGRAGMAALVIEPGFDLDELHRRLASALPDYARPLFLRIGSELAVTSTFKHRKAELARDGFDPTAISDPLYLDDRAKGVFRPLDADRYRGIVAGEVRL